MRKLPLAGMPALLTSRWIAGCRSRIARRDRLDGVAVADVAELDLAADLVGERAQPVLAPCDEHAPPASLGEQPGGRLPDPGRGSRDDRDLLAGHGGNLVNARHGFA